jgi:surface polysaccharide O-acyltransferase-like enzyme
MKSDKFYSVDFFKTIAIFCVIMIHTKPFREVEIFGIHGENFTKIILVLTRFAVPLFFVISGFFMFDGLNKGKSIKIISRIAIMFLFWNLIYFIIGIIWNGSSEIKVLPEKIFTIDFLYYGKTVSIHFWYLAALLYGTLLLQLGVKLKKFNYFFTAFFIMHLIGLLGQSYKFIYDLEIDTRDALFFGTFYIFLGYYLAKIKCKIVSFNISSKVFFIGFLVLSFSQILELALIRRMFGAERGEYYITTIFSVLCLAIFIIREQEFGKNLRITKVGSYVGGIYIIHVMFMGIAGGLLKKIFMDNTLLIQIIYTPLVLLFSYYFMKIIDVIFKLKKKKLI